ncbi:MAG: NAD(P)H-binding protein [Rudanella sp.]|nr:NAD(P)H-binding protein [Rudanella sp.]
MNYVITGSLGHISKPIVQKLAKAGHSVTVITSKPDNAAPIQKLGAKAAVGSVEDANFLIQSFAGADAVYLMIPPKWGVTDWRYYQNKVADNYTAALQANHIPYAVVLSSVGAHMGNGAGPVDGLHDLEQKLKILEDLNVKILRPSYFMENLFGMAGMVKGMGIMGSNFGDEKIVLVHTSDIAAAALQNLMNLDFAGHQVQYIASDERTGADIARVLGEAVGKPETPWMVFSDEQSKQGMLQAGLNEEMANGYTTMGLALRNGTMQEDYFANRPATLGKVKLEDFAKNEFAPAFEG